MHSLTSKEEDSTVASGEGSMRQYPTRPHSAIICGATACGKTQYVLQLLETHYRNCFENIIFICPTWRDNETYKRHWIFNDPCVYLIDPIDRKGENRLHDWLRYCHELFRGERTLYVIDDCASSQVLNVKRDKLTELAFSGRHTNQSVWVITQTYKSILKDFRKQTKWTALFYCKDRDSFDECLRENDVIPDEHKADVKKTLADIPHAVVILVTEQPTNYFIEK